MEFYLPNIQNVPNDFWKYTLNPNADKIHLEPKNSAQLRLRDSPETNKWWDTRQKCHNSGVGVGQPFFSKSVFGKPIELSCLQDDVDE